MIDPIAGISIYRYFPKSCNAETTTGITYSRTERRIVTDERTNSEKAANREGYGHDKANGEIFKFSPWSWFIK